MEIALFRDATEVVWRVAEHLAARGSGSAVPTRRFVRDADEAHLLCLERTVPVVAMSLDDVLDCALSSHPAAAEVVAFYGVHRGFLSLMTRPGVEDLRGRTVAVDTYSGYAAALFEMLARDGLDWQRDVRVVLAGATDRRYRALLREEFDATLLGTPFDLLAEARHFCRRATVLERLGGYQAVVFAAHRSWLLAEPEAARSLVTAFEGALSWATDPSHREAVARLIRDDLPGEMEPPLLDALVERLFGSRSEFCPQGRIESKDTAVVARLSVARRGREVPLQSVVTPLPRRTR